MGWVVFHEGVGVHPRLEEDLEGVPENRVKAQAVVNVYLQDVEDEFTHFSISRGFVVVGIVGIIDGGVNMLELDLKDVTVFQIFNIDIIKVGWS